jgi:hypothetical protein
MSEHATAGFVSSDAMKERKRSSTVAIGRIASGVTKRDPASADTAEGKAFAQANSSVEIVTTSLFSGM